MRCAIVAGGEGSRLKQEGINVPKPLVRLGDETLVGRLIRIFAQQGAEEVVLLARTDADEVVSEAERVAKQFGTTLTTMRADTPSSMHSLSVLAPCLSGKPFCLTTVDTIFSEESFAQYIAAFGRMLAANDADGLMGVTTLIDDEKPLYVETGTDNLITAFCDEAPSTARYVSAGVYGLTPKALVVLQECISRGESRLRNFQRALIANSQRLRAFDFGPVIDIDHATDIPKALNLM